MSSMPWFRVYSEVLHDRKLRKVCQLCRQPKAVVLGVWITLLAIASESPERGRLLIGAELPLDLEDLAEETGLPIAELDALMTTFKSLGMVLETGDIARWDERQFKSDHSTARVRRWRQKQRMKRGETLQQHRETVIDSDSYTDSEKEALSNLGGEKGKQTEEEAPNWTVEFEKLIALYRRLFPDKPQPRPTTQSYRDKFRVRFKQAHFRESWRLALERAAESPTLQQESWFDLRFFLRNDDNYQKCLDRWMSWQDERRAGLEPAERKRLEGYEPA